ncbi:hypothetical protein P5V15_004502 [Pogonomyrmex californicus]
MNPMRSTTFRGDEESRSTHNEDNTYSILRSRTEEEKQRRRREWQRQQERERQHEKLKQQKILEYERKRALALKYAEEKSSRHSRSKSGSESPSHLRYRDRSTSTASKSGSLHEKSDGHTSGTVPLFRGPQNAQINTTELRRIKVDIHRNIPVKGPVPELQRDILNPEDVIVKRREGEGCKPIFDREEIKKAAIKTNEIEERRTVVAVDKEQSASTSKLHTSRKCSLSLSPIRNHRQIYNTGYLSSYQSRHMDLKSQNNKTDNHGIHRNDRRSSIEKHRDYKEKYTERDVSKHIINRSRSRERNPHSRPFLEERSYRERYRERSKERSLERRTRDRDRNRDRDRDKDGDRDRARDRERDRDRSRNKDRSREQRNVTPHYIESPIPVPIYYGSFPPRPIVVSPMVPLRGQIPPIGRGRHPALMAPVRPFPPRFVPPDMYRLGHPPPNPRYGPF